MDECLSWQAKLAKSNINILGVTDGVATIEFTYHPKPGVFKWCKTLINVEDTQGLEEVAVVILEDVLCIRKELEG